MKPIDIPRWLVLEIASQQVKLHKAAKFAKQAERRNRLEQKREAAELVMEHQQRYQMLLHTRQDYENHSKQVEAQREGVAELTQLTQDMGGYAKD